MEKTIETIALHGGILCLDFVNTVYAWIPERKGEFLYGFDDLVRFAKRHTIISEEEQPLVLEREKGRQAIYDKAVVLRDLIYELFSQYITERKVSESVLGKFNHFLTEARTHLRLEYTETGFQQILAVQNKENEKILWTIILSVADTLISDKLSRIKRCGSCGWLFLDTSKNSSRRWCDMQVCGSQIKAKNYYHRMKDKQM
ncbi:CGNR zinc finger domain-containing protein [Xanthocytophaga agilis]|uniref:CGNR zinc finger domain-containing protein n=1 Tax=Xanthocytophaga agilis TaxID=3048010 RepID=A0AAE3R0E5_9BACT|nr:CGNR zinc finger domain-containing protein [Xanthocytophaga agilis]MDJ1501446.1 CGNR zinc finger domain-containing protein [Xanthocytophaga agilis]